MEDIYSIQSQLKNKMDSQNITIKLIQFTKALSECMDENLRLESQLKEIDEELAIIEDTIKGEEGDIITKIRANISNLKN